METELVDGDTCTCGFRPGRWVKMPNKMNVEIFVCDNCYADACPVQLVLLDDDFVVEIKNTVK